MTVYSNYKLGTSFELADKLTVAMDARFVAALDESRKHAHERNLELVGGLGYGCVLIDALAAGIVTHWKSRIMPQLPASVDEMDIPAAYWAGEIIWRWVQEQREVPKVSFFKRLMRRLADM